MEETAGQQRTKDRAWLQYDSEQAWDRGGCQRENSRQVQGRRPGIFQSCRACLGRQEHLEEPKRTLNLFHTYASPHRDPRRQEQHQISTDWGASSYSITSTTTG